MSRQWDALVIGAGPAGLRAASVIAESGLEVVLVDEQAFPGVPARNTCRKRRSGSWNRIAS